MRGQLPNPFALMNYVVGFPAPYAAVSVAHSALSSPQAGAADLISSSAGVEIGSLPSGESDPAVTLDYAPADSRLSSAVEQQFCKLQGEGSNPSVGSNPLSQAEIDAAALQRITELDAEVRASCATQYVDGEPMLEDDRPLFLRRKTA